MKNQWSNYRMWYRPANAVANGGWSAAWLGEWKSTDILFRARSQPEAQKKADKFWREAQYGAGSMLCVPADEDLRQTRNAPAR